MNLFKNMLSEKSQCQYVTSSGVACENVAKYKCARCGMALCEDDACVVESARGQDRRKRYCDNCLFELDDPF